MEATTATKSLLCILFTSVWILAWARPGDPVMQPEKLSSDLNSTRLSCNRTYVSSPDGVKEFHVYVSWDKNAPPQVPYYCWLLFRAQDSHLVQISIQQLQVGSFDVTQPEDPCSQGHLQLWDPLSVTRTMGETTRHNSSILSKLGAGVGGWCGPSDLHGNTPLTFYSVSNTAGVGVSLKTTPDYHAPLLKLLVKFHPSKQQPIANNPTPTENPVRLKKKKGMKSSGAGGPGPPRAAAVITSPPPRECAYRWEQTCPPEKPCLLRSPHWPGSAPRNVTCTFLVLLNASSIPTEASSTRGSRNAGGDGEGTWALKLETSPQHKFVLRDPTGSFAPQGRPALRVWKHCHLHNGINWIEVYDGAAADSPLLLRWCEGESDQLPPLITSGSQLRVVYHSALFDHIIQPINSAYYLPAWELVVTQVWVPKRHACGGKWTSETHKHGGVLQRPYHALAPDRSCEWILQGKENERIQIHFRSFKPVATLASGADGSSSSSSSRVNGNTAYSYSSEDAIDGAVLQLWDGTFGGIGQPAPPLIAQFGEDVFPPLCEHALLSGMEPSDWKRKGRRKRKKRSSVTVSNASLLLFHLPSGPKRSSVSGGPAGTVGNPLGKRAFHQSVSRAGSTPESIATRTARISGTSSLQSENSKEMKKRVEVEISSKTWTPRGPSNGQAPVHSAAQVLDRIEGRACDRSESLLSRGPTLTIRLVTLKGFPLNHLNFSLAFEFLQLNHNKEQPVEIKKLRACRFEMPANASSGRLSWPSESWLLEQQNSRGQGQKLAVGKSPSTFASCSYKFRSGLPGRLLTINFHQLDLMVMNTRGEDETCRSQYGSVYPQVTECQRAGNQSHVTSQLHIYEVWDNYSVKWKNHCFCGRFSSLPVQVQSKAPVVELVAANVTAGVRFELSYSYSDTHNIPDSDRSEMQHPENPTLSPVGVKFDLIEGTGGVYRINSNASTEVTRQYLKVIGSQRSSSLPALYLRIPGISCDLLDPGDSLMVFNGDGSHLLARVCLRQDLHNNGSHVDLFSTSWSCLSSSPPLFHSSAMFDDNANANEPVIGGDGSREGLADSFSSAAKQEMEDEMCVSEKHRHLFIVYVPERKNSNASYSFAWAEIHHVGVNQRTSTGSLEKKSALLGGDTQSSTIARKVQDSGAGLSTEEDAAVLDHVLESENPLLSLQPPQCALFCSSVEACLDPRLACDGVWHCPGGEDEWPSAQCGVVYSILSPETLIVYTGGGAGLVLLIMVGILGGCFLCKRRQRRKKKEKESNSKSGRSHNKVGFASPAKVAVVQDSLPMSNVHRQTLMWAAKQWTENQYL